MNGFGNFPPGPPSGASPPAFGPPQGTPSFAPPQGGPISSAQALAGLGSVDIETRVSFLPPGAAIRLQVTRAYERQVNKIGLCYFVEGKCLAVAAPGGEGHWTGAWPEKANRIPAQVGTEYACRISGISDQASAQAALREYRELLCALWAHRGLRMDYGKDQIAAAQSQHANDASAFAQAKQAIDAEVVKTFWQYGVMTAQYEAILNGRTPGDRAMAEQFAKDIATRTILVQVDVYTSQRGFSKLKHRYHPDNATGV